MQPKNENPSQSIVRLDQPSTARSIISVLLFVHLFCVFVVLASNYRRSPLLGRLVSFFGVYTQALNFDPNFTPFHLTTGQTADDDHILEVEMSDGPAAGQKVLLPPFRYPWLDQRRRFMAVNNLFASQAEFLVDDRDDANDQSAGIATAELSKAVGGYYLRQNGGTHCVVKLVHRLSQPMEIEALPANYPRDNPRADAYHNVLFTADVIQATDGSLVATRRQAARSVAPVKPTK